MGSLEKVVMIYVVLGANQTNANAGQDVVIAKEDGRENAVLVITYIFIIGFR